MPGMLGYEGVNDAGFIALPRWIVVNGNVDDT